MFTIAAFAISWAIWLPLIAGAGVQPGSAWLLYYGGVIGPAAAAFLCAFGGIGPSPVVLRKRVSRWNVHPLWYATAVLLPFVVRGCAVGAVLLVTDQSWPVVFRPAAAIALTTLLMFLLVPFEEIGWRGYALPVLQRRYRPLTASLILGVIWAVWHLPLAWAVVGYQQSDEPWRYMTRFLITILPLSCLATWFFNGSGESVPLVSLFHIAVNMADFLLVLPSQAGETLLLVTSMVASLVVAAVWMHDREMGARSDAPR